MNGELIAAEYAEAGAAAHQGRRRVLAMFPGQGSQREGMAAHLIREHPGTAGAVFESAEQCLGLPLRELCVEADAERLRATEVAQPAILATALATFEVLRAEGFTPDLVAGHSLGEFAALAAAGVLELADALALVRLRGELMAEIAAAVPGAMTAVAGVPAARIEEICAGIGGVVELANYNAPDQSVISGTAEAVAAATELLRAEGANSLVALRVGAPFHCSLMAELEERFAAGLHLADFRNPTTTVISSVTAHPVSTGQQARDLLRRQLTAPVRWIEVIAAATELGCTDYLEIGPGRVLSGLANRMVGAATVRSTQDARRIAAAVAEYA
ncbi:ACP S-malonyltransferase [Nocardia seriolae]|uniref:Malonyl CoA-acyl carrier protein transacylase n=1 Tax=Nocardia seriolae TaxID=37332 RepID=A0ABC9YTU8_9NOCA|nr:ACP S-malonyltransferase [Nocardia seriolae]WKY50173.1 ACP S-malonyltransferase [Nocardia seriolae]BAW06009.1 malonate decarboxylase subunit epsilon [Nocardia seriolae]BEK87331.1 ACP S-malonyltransferase [Nocardia seriolae]BEK96898.1 ACP S-malonyltransferase [Nocardia seriolae]GAM47013.1 malonate decarboxylase subunit epsilon [Nocardia seriolae]